jgi:NhaA family Na+:H+ antiporter
VRPLERFLRGEASGGLLLMAAAALALLVANSPLAAGYFAALHLEAGGLSLLHWINDGLMALFFLTVGLEIKRELLGGEFSTWRRRALPGLAALGGRAVPALIYAALNAGDPAALRGWAIPSATDIAFALAVIQLAGPRAPASLKLFLAALAILDDLGAVLIIAVAYTADIAWSALGLAAVAAAVLLALNRFRVTRLAPYLLVGAFLWFFMLKSGVHATIAGVVLAFAIPSGAPLRRLEHRLHPWIAYLVLPLFGFANAGLVFSAAALQGALGSVPVGAALGLFLGKPIGVFGAAYAAVRLKLAERPERASWPQVFAVAMLCGIGFTMSLFIGLLAFGDPALQEEAKLGVLAGSLLSGIGGYCTLRLASPAAQARPPRA